MHILDAGNAVAYSKAITLDHIGHVFISFDMVRDGMLCRVMR